MIITYYMTFWLCRNEAIVPLFKTIEEDPNIGRMVVDYSISQTTLEEVFFNVSRGLNSIDPRGQFSQINHETRPYQLNLGLASSPFLVSATSPCSAYNVCQ